MEHQGNNSFNPQYIFITAFHLTIFNLLSTSSRTSSDTRDGFPLAEYSPKRLSGQSSHEDCMPFPLDDESSGQDGSPSLTVDKNNSISSSYRFSVRNKADNRTPECSPSKSMGLLSRYRSHKKVENTGYIHDFLGRNTKETKITEERGANRITAKGAVLSLFLSSTVFF